MLADSTTDASADGAVTAADVRDGPDAAADGRADSRALPGDVLWNHLRCVMNSYRASKGHFLTPSHAAYTLSHRVLVQLLLRLHVLVIGKYVRLQLRGVRELRADDAADIPADRALTAAYGTLAKANNVQADACTDGVY